eukprot:TRINITY_DN115931_c0_g1_i1.p1 TRINITY_DN115931_c0_g1~~TRINITY_DN115931_c0_g1_i1.p1  ORF type:complete len:125 (+),score=21.36 TRINITY_DN115931_c0_g1_i1:45-377(+)
MAPKGWVTDPASGSYVPPLMVRAEAVPPHKPKKAPRDATPEPPFVAQGAGLNTGAAAEIPQQAVVPKASAKLKAIAPPQVAWPSSAYQGKGKNARASWGKQFFSIGQNVT